jgi:1-acyl-sn-glycerol-3-phosphate acyltransferase
VRQIARVWQLVRAGSGFFYFGVGGWLLFVCGLPLARLLARLRGLSPEHEYARTQRLIHHASRSFIGCATRVLCVIRVRWAGEEALARGPVLVVANHPSLIDTPLLASKMEQADFIVSPAWTRIGWMRRAIESAGYLHADRGADVVRNAAARLRAGRSVVVYPEGSRTPLEGLRRFQRGAAHIALEANCDILPVTIRVVPRVLLQGQRLTDFPFEKPEWWIEVHAPIHPGDHVREGEERPLAARRLTGILEAYFEKRWDRGSG